VLKIFEGLFLGHSFSQTTRSQFHQHFTFDEIDTSIIAMSNFTPKDGETPLHFASFGLVKLTQFNINCISIDLFEHLNCNCYQLTFLTKIQYFFDVIF